MYRIHFFREANGACPVREYIENLARKQDKDSRIKLNKFYEYIRILGEYGTRAGEPYVKHLEGDLWELRPLRDRIFFVAWVNNSFVLLHQFQKKTQKTPRRELERARNELKKLQQQREESYEP